MGWCQKPQQLEHHIHPTQLNVVDLVRVYGSYDLYNCSGLVRQVTRFNFSVSVYGEHYRFSHIRPLLASRDDGIESATYSALVTGLNDCSNRVPDRFGVLFAGRNGT